MELQEIEIFIDPDGKVRIQVRGIKGTACLDITKELEEALGGQIELREMTPEALEEAVTEQVQRLQQQNK
jgi:hypothetical protein